MSDTRTLAEREVSFIKHMKPSDEAKRLAPKLIEEAEEHRIQARMAKTPAGAELHDLAALHLERAAELLRILELEQWRQRNATAIYLQGRMDRFELRRINESWNFDPVPVESAK